jgi:DNA-binding transcriptional ArsR family regulator
MPSLSTSEGKKRAPAKLALDADVMFENARKASNFLKALSHETRLLILCLLVDGERTVNELEQILDLRQSAVSQQLARLRADDLVEARRNGKSVHYSLSRPEVVEIISTLYRTFCRR